jgi:hypothetical protein
VSPVKYELGIYIPEDILQSHRCENLKSYSVIMRSVIPWAWRQVLKKELHNFCSLANILELSGQREMRETGHAVHMGHNRIQNLDRKT